MIFKYIIKKSIIVFILLIFILVNINICIDAINARALNKVFVKYKDLNIGLQIYNLTKNKIVYSRNSNNKFTPASITKLFTSLAALDILGPQYKFKTQLLLDGYIKNRIVHGDIYLKASGDPSLSSKSLQNLIKKFIGKYNIKSITGSFFIDDMEFDRNFFPPGSTIDDIGSSWLSPVGSLVVDHKGVSSKSNLYGFVNDCKRNSLFFDIKKFISKLLKEEKVILRKVIDFKKSSKGLKAVSIIYSPKLRDVIMIMNKKSDNLYADCLFKKMGSFKFNKGNWVNGLKAVNGFIQQQLKIRSSDIKIVDGSGLSRYNLISPEQIINLLKWVVNKPYYSDFVRSLSVNGVDGTLRNRMLKNIKKINGKTGSMGGVSCLAGYIKNKKETFILSIFINNFISKYGIQAHDLKREIEDAVCNIIITT